MIEKGGGMRIKKWVSFEDEMEIDLSAEDITVLLDESETAPNVVARQINNMATFLNGVPDSAISGMNQGMCEVISNFFKVQAARYHRQEQGEKEVIHDQR